MNSRSKRDAKFLIFQSLYIIAIAILFYKGTDLSLNPVQEVKLSDTIIAISKLDSLLKLPTIDMTNEVILPKLPEGMEYRKVTDKDEIVSKSELEMKDKRIAELERQIVRNPQTRPDKEKPPVNTEGIEGGKVRDK